MPPTHLGYRLVLTVALIVNSFSGAAATIHVPATYPTIQAALDAASAGDEIVVATGKYAETIVFPGRDLVLRSSDPLDTNTVATTIIDAQNMGSVVTFAGTEQSSTVLSGFKIINGLAMRGAGINGNHTHATIERNWITDNYADGIGGGGIYNSHGLIHHNQITSNEAFSIPGGRGGGLYYCNGVIEENQVGRNVANGIWDGCSGGGLSDCGGTIRNNLIALNVAGNLGGGLAECYGDITSNTIWGNHGFEYGGGIYSCGQNGVIEGNWITFNSAHVGAGVYGCTVLRNNRITSNTATYGGGVCACTNEMSGNLIAYNSAGNGGGVSGCDAVLSNNTICYNTASVTGGGLWQSHGFVRNCIIWGNTAPAEPQLSDCPKTVYSCVQSSSFSGHNIDADPQFVNAAADDFHLAADSPCRDAGSTWYLPHSGNSDADGNGRLFNTSVDMGMYEYGGMPDQDGDLLNDSQEAILTTNPSDIDTDDDTLADGVEVLRGTNPKAASSATGIAVPAQFPTIQQAVFLAFNNEEITVAPGTYDENLLMRQVTLQGSNHTDWPTVNSTILDGGARYSVVTFAPSDPAAAMIRGLTIRNGDAYYGGGICGGTNAQIVHNRIYGNRGVMGGGIYGVDELIYGNIIASNTAHADHAGFGGALASCDAPIRNNLIYSNIAGGNYGQCGGLYSCSGPIENNTIVSNIATYVNGGLGSCHGTIRNCIIWNNMASSQPGFSICGPVTYSCIQQTEGSNNIFEDPQFADPLSSNYRLQPTSPCIDAGCAIAGLADDLYGLTRPFPLYDGRGDGSHYDIGACEYVTPSSVQDWQLY